MDVDEWLSSMPEETPDESDSNIDENETAEIMGTTLEELARNTEKNACELVKLIDLPSELADNIYDELCLALEIRFVSGLANLTTVNYLAVSVLTPIVLTLNDVLQLKRGEVTISIGDSFDDDYEDNDNFEDNLDCVIYRNVEKYQKVLMVVTCITDNVNNGLPQLLVKMRAAFERNQDGQTIYGCSTIGDKWQLVTYNPKEIKCNGFKVLEERQTIVITDNMRKDKENWLNKCRGALDIIYSCCHDAVSRYQKSSSTA